MASSSPFIEVDRTSASSSPVRLGLATALVLHGFGFYLAVPMQPRQLRMAWFLRRSTRLTSFLHALLTLASTLTKLSHFWHRRCILCPIMVEWLTRDNAGIQLPLPRSSIQVLPAHPSTLLRICLTRSSFWRNYCAHGVSMERNWKEVKQIRQSREKCV